MMTTLQRPARTVVADMDQAATEPARLDDQSPLRPIEQTSTTTDRAAERHRRATQLAALADGDREPLEHLRGRFLRRLHRTSSDFDATEGLRTVELALSMTPRSEGLWEWQQRERHRPRRWWQRRRGRQPR